MPASFRDQLVEMNACREAIEWVGDRDLVTAWMMCQQADWMLWLAARLLPDDPRVILAVCACARTALQYVPAGEERPRLAIEAAERCATNPSADNMNAARVAGDGARTAAWHTDLAAWAACDAARAAVTAVRTAAGAAACDAARAAAGDAARAAGAAAWAAVTAACDAAWAAGAAPWVAVTPACDAARAAAGDAARDVAYQQMCGLIREIIPRLRVNDSET